MYLRNAHVLRRGKTRAIHFYLNDFLSKFLLTPPLSFVEVIDCAIHRHPFVAGVFQHKQCLQEASSSLLDSRHGWCWKKVPILGRPDSPMEWIFSDRQTNQQTWDPMCWWIHKGGERSQSGLNSNPWDPDHSFDGELRVESSLFLVICYLLD